MVQASDSPNNAMAKNLSNDSMLSPLPLNHNNNHVDSLPQHTYATHKLPSFIEMMSTQKSRQTLNDPNVSPSPNLNSISSSQPAQEMPSKMEAPDINHVDRPIHTDIESNGTYTNGDDSLHAIDLSTTGSLVVHGPKSTENAAKTAPTTPTASTDHTDNGNAIQTGNDSTIDQYIAKNPNLTFKGSGDIMNMDIIFENVSIEEDLTIGNAATSASNAVSALAGDGVEAIVEPTNAKGVSECQADNVDICGIRYEIITVENPKGSIICGATDNEDVKLAPNPIESIEEMASADADTIPVINHESYDDGNYVYSSNEVVIMSCSSLEVAAEVETADDSTETTIALDELNPYQDAECNNPEAIDTKEEVLVKDDPNVLMTVQTTDSSTKDRKRKRKVMPVLANNKRTRRSNQVNKTETPDETQVTDYQEKEETIANDEPVEESQTTNRIEEHVDEALDNSNDNQMKCDPEDDNDDQEPSFLDQLVVVESQDPNDPNRTIHEVYVVDPETNEMSEKPLDLADHVIQRIRTALL